MTSAWRSRIVGTEEVAPDQLLANPLNWRRHPEAQRIALEGALDAIGWIQQVIVNRTTGHLVDGHARVELALKRNEPLVPVVYVELTEDEERAALASLDPLAGMAVTDPVQLLAVTDGLELGVASFDKFLADQHERAETAVAASQSGSAGLTKPDEIPDLPAEPTSERGDVWILGPHRVMCGNSTSIEDVLKLCGGDEVRGALLHADPPYGMGKAAEGVANDNLYRDELDTFQLAWWSAWRRFLVDNASAYIWGNAPDLWRLWYRAGLGETETMELRNEIVWDKKAIAGMKSPELTQFPMATERCLFFQVGEQFLGNINAADFPEQWEPLRAYLEGEAKAAGVGPRTIAQLCGCQMYGHWFSRSQFTLIPEKHYARLVATYPSHFRRTWADLKSEWDRVKGNGRTVINGKLEGMRSYFDNAHDIMRDVWEFERVTGEERFGHATPKPVAMMERVMKSSLPEGGLCLEPFGGSGSTLIGAERTGRRCFTMELQPIYVDVIVRRWQEYTGKAAVLEEDGSAFAEVEQIRRKRAAAA